MQNEHRNQYFSQPNTYRAHTLQFKDSSQHVQNVYRQISQVEQHANSLKNSRPLKVLASPLDSRGAVNPAAVTPQNVSNKKLGALEELVLA